MDLSIRKQVLRAGGFDSESFVTRLPVPEMLNKSMDDINVIHRLQRRDISATRSVLSAVKLDHRDSLVAPLVVNVSHATHRLLS